MEKKALSNILEGKLFHIPDYQRGYTWEEKQWHDFVQDIDALIDENIVSHYTGTIVIYQPTTKPIEYYGTKKLEVVDVVDGQQRLTTCSLYLSIILNKLIDYKQEEFNAEIPIYLFSGSKCKLKLNNDTADFFFDLISKGVSNVEPISIHQKRIYDGYLYLMKYIDKQLYIRKDNGEEYLRDLFDAIIRKLNFSFYTIEVESEIGMTFELMNSRGKGLTSMELLKNYLMYWVYRNIVDISEKEDFTRLINKTWKEVYVNITKSNGSESQCLRIAWTLYVSHTPKNWDGYNGFKSDEVIPLRNFKAKCKNDVKSFLLKFLNGLALISKHYTLIINPQISEKDSVEETLLTSIRNVGNIANFLPLMVAVKILREYKNISDDDYYEFLKSLQIFSYRVFLWEGKRSNAGQSKFYRLADDIHSNNKSLKSVTDEIYGTINWYSNENSFRKALSEDFFDWYHHRRLLKYTLFQYELFLLKGKNKPKLKWDDLSDSSIEHILPQNPKEDSEWFRKWSETDRIKYLHDISNLVLTKDNSRYLNFEFDIKKGMAGHGYSYANSDIRQERRIAKFDEWTVENLEKRREDIIEWIIETWGIDNHYETQVEDMIEDEEEIVSYDND